MMLRLYVLMWDEGGMCRRIGSQELQSDTQHLVFLLVKQH